MKKKKTKETGTSTGKQTPQYVINQIVVKPPQRKTYDVGAWRTALKSADNGRVKTLYDLLDDILLDGVLGDAVQKRIDAVTNSELAFQDANGEEVEEINTLMDTLGWEELLTIIMKKRMYGRCGAEINLDDGLNVKEIPAKHINLSNQTLLHNDTDEIGMPYPGDDRLMVLGNERDFGLLLKAAPYAIYKRGGFGDWSQWVELFGMPQRIGKYNTYDPESRKLLENAFETAGSAPWLVVPKETDIETKESNGGSGSSYNEFRQANNEEMLITILGQTMTTVQGEKGARSLGEVHKDVEEGKNRSDLRFVQRILNQVILPILAARGIPVKGGKFVFPKATEQLTVDELCSLAEIIDIPQSYVHEKYAIPEPKDGEAIARRARTETVPGINAPNDSDNPPEDDPIENADRNLFLRLWDFFVKAPRDGASLGKAHIHLNDSISLDERIIARVAKGEANYFDAELFRYICDDLLKGVETVFKENLNQADIAYNLRDDAFITALEQNLFHFSAGKTLAEIQQLNKAFRDSASFEDFSKKAGEICTTFNKTWQKTEYDTAVLTAESASNYQRLIKKKKLFPYWKYVTAGDEKVREEHRELDGIVLSADDPRWNKIFPPNGWKCRCRVVPIMSHEVTEAWLLESARIVDAYLGTDEWKMVEQQHWDSNRGKRGEIFNKNQMYVRKFPTMAAKIMKKITPERWGLEASVKKLTTESRIEITPCTGDADSWWNEHKVIESGVESLKVKDYAGREWYMTKEKFESHTSNKVKSRAFRTRYLNCIKEIMADPDEVWLGQELKDSAVNDPYLNNWLLIKYYKGVAVVCVCKLQQDKMVFKSWYELKDKKVRNGFLVRKK